MASRSSSFSPLSRDAIDKIRVELAEHHIVMPPTDEGSFDAPHGVKVTYCYDEEKKTLYVDMSASVFVIGLASSALAGGIKPFLGS